MKRKIVPILVMTLLIATAVLPVAGMIKEYNEDQKGSYVMEFESTISNNFEMAIDLSDSGEITCMNSEYHIYEGLPWKLHVTAYWDPPQEKQICLWVDYETLPAGATFPECTCDYGEVTSTLEWTPSVGQAGTYYITFYVGESCYETIGYFTAVVVVHPYEPNPQDTYEIYECHDWHLQLTAYWVPPNPEKLICLWVDTNSLPYGATFTECHCDYGEVTGDLYWHPQIGQAGEYIITFYYGEYCGYYLRTASIRVIVLPGCEEENIAFKQIDWFGSQAPMISDSEWGEFSIETSPEEDVTFINVIARIDGGIEWIIRNIIVLPISVDPYSKTITHTFDLGSLGVIRGENAASLDYYLDISTSPLAIPPTGQLVTVPISSIVYDNVGGKEEGTLTDPGSPREPSEQVSTCEVDYNFRVLFPNVDLDSNDDVNGCGPAAQANSLKWLSDEYDDIDIDDSLQEIFDDVDDAIGRKPGCAIGDEEFLTGKLKYIKDKKLPIEVKFQDDELGDKDYKTNDGTAFGKGKKPTFEFIKQEFEAGEDVELGFTYNNGGGHWVTVTGWYSICGELQGVWVADDGDQDSKDGKRDRMCDLTKRTDGFLEISNYGRNKIDIVVSESPHKRPNKPTCSYDENRDELVVSATDPDGHKVRYGVDWDGDGKVDEWTEYVPSGTEKKIDCGGRTKPARVIAEDEPGAQSEWTSVNSKNKAINTLFLSFLENHPHLFPLLQKLLELK